MSNNELERPTTIYQPELSNMKPIRSKNCTIHSHVWIGDQVIVKDHTKIQAFAFIPNGVLLGEGVFIGPHVCFTNDKYPPNDEFRPTTVCDGASIGANATIICGVRIGVGAVIGAGSVVTKDVPDFTTVWGNPAKEKGS